MGLSEQEGGVIISDETKSLSGNIEWEEASILGASEFTVCIESEGEYPIFVKGWYNPYSGKLSFSIIYSDEGRIYGLDLGSEHQNPDGEKVGEKHKHYWKGVDRDKWAYVPEDITAAWNNPLGVWQQFCAEANLTHHGTMGLPVLWGRLQP